VQRTRDGVLETPSPEVGILLGITRAKLLSLAPSTSGISEVREVSIGPERLADAAEVFLTSTTWEVLPVTRWEGREVGAGKAGPIARRLRERLQGLYPRGPSA
jgi:branched-subunit amino acid aminotransferase/4-amino-4-deoxychorismate lyase